ncbi:MULTISPECIES: response regulator transcription factor [Parvimonas]|uniref:Response regulator transcription factor n=1 Tax=Parvimonas micra TaxID=33033 RepID=A0AAX3K7V2_9FIRM|nr:MULTISPECIES: response regulator transcription factor [Parvimonas]MEB3058438.1 response regulator transcription factor [Parvimonas sp. D9]WBB31265.1 response regulator transcription factor [Parvimonas micra]WBB32780.1 response regulator transcription factor [Parvimonas micra]
MKILMVDDDLLVLNALSTILGKSGFEIVLATTDSKKAVETYKESEIDVVILDIRMKEVNGVDVAIEILEYDKDAKIMLLTTFNDRDDIIRALNKGVLGVILKDNVASLIPAIESVSLGNKILDNELNLKNLFNTTKKDFNLLTQKEIEILEQIAKGLSNKEISEKLFLSEGTVRNYISGILEKLELRDRTQLAIYYYTK